MTFSKEDLAAWRSSEVMREFERIVKEQGLNDTPPEAYLPIKEADDSDTEGQFTGDRSLEWMKDWGGGLEAEELEIAEKRMKREREREEPFEEPEVDLEHDEENLDWLEENVSGWGVEVDEEEKEWESDMTDLEKEERRKKVTDRAKWLRGDPVEPGGEYDLPKGLYEQLTSKMTPLPDEASKDWRNIMDDVEAAMVSKLEKLGYALADQKNIKAAYKVERTLQEIKGLIKRRG